MRTAFRLGLFAAAVLALATPRVVRAQGQSPDQPSVAPTEAAPAQPAEPVAQPAEPGAQPQRSHRSATVGRAGSAALR